MTALKHFFSLAMIPLSFIAMGMALMSFMAGWISPVTSGWITYAGLAMPAILILNLIIAIYWICTKKWWLLLPVTAILLNLGYLTSIFQISSTPDSPQGKQPIKIATYNVGNFRSWDQFDSHYNVCDYFRSNQVDIVCFQEYSERKLIDADTIGKFLGLPYHAVEYLPDSPGNGSAIFSKYPITSQGIIFQTRVNDAAWADIEIGTQTIRIINCHLETTNFNRKRRDLNNRALENASSGQVLAVYGDISSTLLNNCRIRAGQAQQMRQFTDTSSFPVIICGDFNDPPSSYTYHQAKGPLKDSFRTQGNGYGYTFRGIHRLLRIDYILYSPLFKCTGYKSEEKEWSDHNPIISQFYL